MFKSIYVGNLPFSSSEEQVRELFSQYGRSASVKFINDRETGRFRGFGFVEMEDEPAAQAINAA
jgi:RNA recognition motif-containing protein